MKMVCFYKIVYKNLKKLLFKQTFVSPPFPVKDGIDLHFNYSNCNWELIFLIIFGKGVGWHYIYIIEFSNDYHSIFDYIIWYFLHEFYCNNFGCHWIESLSHTTKITFEFVRTVLYCLWVQHMELTILFVALLTYVGWIMVCQCWKEKNKS